MEVQNQHAPWYYRFKWKIENISTLEEEDNFSPVFKTGPYKWKLLAFRRGCNVDDYFSVYVVAVECTNYPRYARFSLAVVNDQTDNAFRKGPGDKMFRFTENESDWGLDDFIKFKELIDPSNGYIVDDACTIEVDLYLKSTQNSIEEGRQLMLCPNYSGKTLSHEKTKKRKKPAKNNSTNVQRKQRGPDRFKQKEGEKPIESCQEAIRDGEESVESGEEATQHGKQVIEKGQETVQTDSKRKRAAVEGEKVVEGGEILDGKQVVANGKENEKIIEESASSENSDFEKQRTEKTKMALKNKVSTANEASLYKWSPRGPPPPSPQTQPQPPLLAPPPQPTSTTMQHNNNTHAPLSSSSPVWSSYSALMSPNSSTSYKDHHDHHLHQSSLEDFFQAYGVRCYTVAKISELGFTVNTLLEMRDEDLDVMMNNVSQMYRYELLVGERYGIKAAVHAEQRNRSRDDSTTNPLDALSQEGLSEEPVQQEKEVLGSGDALENVPNEKKKKKQQQRSRKGVLRNVVCEDEGGGSGSDGGGGGVRHREHPFIVTEPGEVARGKKNGLDCLFHLYEQCRDFLMEVQNIAKEAGEKCPTKVNNQVFRYAKKAGASYINKPKMRHYVHCYALHCLDPEASNALRRAFKERGENVGAWRQACYEPLVKMAALEGDSDIDAIFENHPRLCIWYVPTKLRNLCHAQRQIAASTAAATGSGITSAAVD